MIITDEIHDLLLEVYHQFAKQDDLEAVAEPNFRIKEFMDHTVEFFTKKT